MLQYMQWRTHSNAVHDALVGEEIVLVNNNSAPVRSDPDCCVQGSVCLEGLYVLCKDVNVRDYFVN